MHIQFTLHLSRQNAQIAKLISSNINPFVNLYDKIPHLLKNIEIFRGVVMERQRVKIAGFKLSVSSSPFHASPCSTFPAPDSNPFLCLIIRTNVNILLKKVMDLRIRKLESFG